MRAYWILPNRQQKDDLLASDGAKVMPLRQILEPKLRPPGFSHGVPAELLERCAPTPLAQILFAQKFPDWNAGRQLFCVSTPAGVDSSGRIVHLSLLLLLEQNERPRFDLSCAALSELDAAYARALMRRLTTPSPDDCWAESVLRLRELPSSRGPATNVELQRSVVPFYSLYAAGTAGLTRKATTWRKLRTRSAIFLLLVAAVGVWLCERACQHPSRPSTSTGAIAWRSS